MHRKGQDKVAGKIAAGSRCRLAPVGLPLL
jgi:hypothetical protein